MKIKRIICFFFAVVFIVMALPLSVGAKTSMDATDVYSDLVGMNTDFSLYKKNTEDKIAKVVELLEYAYDANGNQNDYGLYLYVYNPSCEKINTSSQYNTIQLATETKSGTTEYMKYKLIFISKSGGSGQYDVENLFYKFKVDLRSSFASSLNKTKRVYHLVDLELQYPNELNPRTTNMSVSYRYTGYQGYHGVDGAASASSTLYAYRENLETIEVNLKPATWKTVSSDKGMNYRYEVSSVYFSIPDYYLEKYGNMADPNYKGLEAVHGEYYEYRVNGLATNNGSLFSRAEEAESKKLVSNAVRTKYSHEIQRNKYYYYDQDVEFWFETGSDAESNKRGFNYKGYLKETSNVKFDISMLMNTFYYDGRFDYISSDVLEDEIFAPRNNGYSENGNEKMVWTKVDEGRTAGLNEYHISVGDKELNDLMAAYATDNSKLVAWLSGKGYLNKDDGLYAPIYPIDMLEDKDFPLTSSDEAIGNVLFVSEGDVSDLKAYYNEAKADGKTTYLMRFAVTDYYIENVDVKSNKDVSFEGDHYYFEKTVFHNFDILAFTFKNSEGKLTTVPVSSKPITIVGTVDKPLDEKDKPLADAIDKFADLKPILKWLILALGVIIIFVILTFFITPLTTIFKIIVAPFKLIGKGISKASEHKRYKKEEARKDAEERRKEAEERRKEAREAKERDKKRESENDRLRRLFNKQLKREAVEREKNRKGEK